jgi:hypothetical protein
MKTGEMAKIDPKITGLKNWIQGVVIKIRYNPFIGNEVAIKDTNGVIYFDSEKYFKAISK